jgi:peptide deformylase
MPVQADQLHIVYYPAPILRKVADPVPLTPGQPASAEVQAVVQRMFVLMHELKGVGLAAPQVGLPWRLFVANPTGNPEDNLAFLNPLLSNPARETAPHEEGCLSIPGVNGDITRPVSITLDAIDPNGNPIHLEATDLLARIIQHETDHLNGILILDRMTPMDRMANRRTLADLERAAR